MKIYKVKLKKKFKPKNISRNKSNTVKQGTQVLEMTRYLYKLSISPNCAPLVFTVPVKVKGNYISHSPKGFPIPLNGCSGTWNTPKLSRLGELGKIEFTLQKNL